MDPLTASIAFTVGSGVMSGVGGLASAQGAAAQSDIAAKAGQIRAEQTDKGYREELNRHLGTIKAIRASSGVSGSSPTAIAIAAREREVSETNRQRKVRDIRNQVQADKIESRMHTTAGYINLGKSVFQTGASVYDKL